MNILQNCLICYRDRIRVQEQGPGSNIRFSWSLHVIALLFWFSEWAHLSPNSRGLLRYAATNSATTCTFCPSYRKMGEKLPKYHPRNLSSFHKMTLGHQKIGMGNLTAISKNIVGFLKNPEFLAIFRPGKV